MWSASSTILKWISIFVNIVISFCKASVFPPQVTHGWLEPLAILIKYLNPQDSLKKSQNHK